MGLKSVRAELETSYADKWKKTCCANRNIGGDLYEPESMADQEIIDS